MPFSGRGERRARRRRGRILTRMLLAVSLASRFACAQTPNPARKKTEARRTSELTLAGLRPGKDKTALAIAMYKKPGASDPKQDGQISWPDPCRELTLTVDFDSQKSVQVIRVTHAGSLAGDCGPVAPGPWKTGQGLRVGDPAKKVAQLYGEPDSRSPSTKDGQPLELWYYAFDWAGADVPQVMEVLCTKEANGNPGHVMEITLAAPSL
jgi:hypothetical protein